MDIDLLSKMVKELILDNDKVALPGLGYFAAEVVPSTFSDRGYTINPPYRKLYFRQDSGRDGLLARLYAEHNGTGTDVAEHIIEDFVRDMREVLDKEKVIIFPGLGRLRATKENYYFFVPDEELDIYPEGLGLEPVSLKKHTVGTVRKETADAGMPLPSVTEPEMSVSEQPVSPQSVESVPVESLPPCESVSSDESVPCDESVQEMPCTEEPCVENPDAAAVPEAGEKTEKQSGKAGGLSKRARAVLVAFAVLVALAVISLGVFVMLADVCPDFIDSILYSPEELEILNY